LMMAYNGMKAKKLVLDGVGLANGQAKKIQLIKRLTNKPFDLQCQAFNQFLNFLKLDRIREEDQKRQDALDRQTKERYLNRIMDSNGRIMGLAFRQALQWSVDEIKKERVLMGKQRGIMRKMLDQSTRLLGMGFNKLVEEWKAQQSMLKNKLKFLMKTLTDQDSANVLQAYNALKRRKMILDGAGLSDQEAKRKQLLKRLTNKPFDLMCQGWNKFIDFLKSDRKNEQEKRGQAERDQKEKVRIIRRIMNKGLRNAGMAFRQARIHTNEEAEKERILMFKQRGIMRKMSDVSMRLIGMGFNK
jgi:hypothetical protein